MHSDTSKPHQGRGAIILAGGDGTRLSALTSTIAGHHVPKQFCALFGGETLLEQTRRRVSVSISGRATVTVVTRSHEPFYDGVVSEAPRQNLVVQPSNQGTAPAILYALFRLHRMLPNGAIAIFPSDHYVSDDSGFMRHVDAAFGALTLLPDALILLGITAETPETQYGWIEPGQPITHRLSWGPRLWRIRGFYEKPTAAVAQELFSRKCLWNSFVMVARVSTLLALFRRVLPQLYVSFIAIRPTLGTSFEEKAIELVYRNLSPTNFSDGVLANSVSQMAVLPVSQVAWADLGEPERVLAVMRQIGIQSESLRAG